MPARPSDRLVEKALAAAEKIGKSGRKEKQCESPWGPSPTLLDTIAGSCSLKNSFPRIIISIMRKN